MPKLQCRRKSGNAAKIQNKMNIKVLVPFIFLICPTVINSSSSTLQLITDDEFVTISSTEKYMIVLFGTPDCKECDAIEDELVPIREELADTLNTGVFKIHNSNLVQIYNPNREPALVFFRHGVPLLYHGKIDREHILHTFTENREPTVKELDDNTFEHLTQAATGATTGDWFVMFYSRTCVTSHRLTARWEAVGAALKTRMNVARINRLETGAATARRFRVYTTPTFILFHQRKMYRYDFNNHEIDSLVNFATKGYKKIARSEQVPVPKTSFDDLTESIADFIAASLKSHDTPWIMVMAGLSVIIGLITTIWYMNK